MSDEKMVSFDEGRAALLASRTFRRKTILIPGLVRGEAAEIPVDVVQLPIGEVTKIGEATKGNWIAKWVIATARHPGSDRPYFTAADEEGIAAQPNDGWPRRVLEAALEVNNAKGVSEEIAKN